MVRPRWLASFLGRPELGQLWVATLDGRIAGYALAPFYFSIEFDGTVALVDEFFLVPECRGQGVGGRLLSKVLAGLRAEGIGVVRLEVDRRHPEAATLYARLGFVRDGREAWTKRFEIANSQLAWVIGYWLLAIGYYHPAPGIIENDFEVAQRGHADVSGASFAGG